MRNTASPTFDRKTASNDTAGSFTVGLKECCDCVALPQIALNWVESQANSCLIFHGAVLWDLCLHESVSVFVYHTVKEVAEFGVSHKNKADRRKRRNVYTTTCRAATV